jgi:Holliday junction resolvase RusA-like endonuclease
MEKASYRIYLETQLPRGYTPLLGPLQLNATFYFKIAASNVKQARAEQWNYHTMHVDLDNLIKWVCDNCQDMGVFSDDCTICKMSAEKLWTFNEPFTVFTIAEL